LEKETDVGEDIQIFRGSRRSRDQLDLSVPVNLEFQTLWRQRIDDDSTIKLDDMGDSLLQSLHV